MRKIITRLVELDSTPEKIALGFAIGVFTGVTPYWGLHTIMAFLLASLARGNVLAAILGVHVGNPLTAPLLFALTYWTGSWFIDSPPVCFAWKDFSLDAAITLLRQAPHILLVLTAGTFIVGPPMAAVAYWLAKRGVTSYKAARPGKDGGGSA